jgi:hypothetical protein
MLLHWWPVRICAVGWQAIMYMCTNVGLPVFCMHILSVSFVALLIFCRLRICPYFCLCNFWVLSSASHWPSCTRLIIEIQCADTPCGFSRGGCWCQIHTTLHLTCTNGWCYGILDGYIKVTTSLPFSYFLEATESHYRFGLSNSILKLHLYIYLSIYPSLERLACPTGGKELWQSEGEQTLKSVTWGSWVWMGTD